MQQVSATLPSRAATFPSKQSFVEVEESVCLECNDPSNSAASIVDFRCGICWPQPKPTNT